MSDHPIRNAAAITIAVGSLFVAPFLAVVASRNLDGRLAPMPTARILVVPSPVASAATPAPARRSDIQVVEVGEGHHHDHHHRAHGDGGD